MFGKNQNGTPNRTVLLIEIVEYSKFLAYKSKKAFRKISTQLWHLGNSRRTFLFSHANMEIVWRWWLLQIPGNGF